MHSLPEDLSPENDDTFNDTNLGEPQQGLGRSDKPLELCSLQLSASQRQAALLPYRLWRVGAAAAAGGALLAISAQIAAPQLVTSLLVLLGASNPMGQFVLAISSMLVQSGGGLGVASSLGASVAGYKMLRRTEAIHEFILEPLHYPTMSPVQVSLFLVLIRLSCVTCYLLLHIIGLWYSGRI